jgi:hypothetical protein
VLLLKRLLIVVLFDCRKEAYNKVWSLLGLMLRRLADFLSAVQG